MPLITINQMQKYYGDNHVLKGVDLDIDMGEVISIIGRSGSGKSTLLRCINGLEGYQDGSIKLGGMTITNRDSQAREISRSIGMVFQNFNLFPHMTALENVMLAPRRVLKKSAAECRELAQRMLEKVGLGDRLDYYPSSLSGGQQQRVAIARALAMSPKVLLCDEITSALDPELVGEVLKVLEQQARTNTFDGILHLVRSKHLTPRHFNGVHFRPTAAGDFAQQMAEAAKYRHQHLVPRPNSRNQDRLNPGP